MYNVDIIYCIMHYTMYNSLANISHDANDDRLVKHLDHYLLININQH